MSSVKANTANTCGKSVRGPYKKKKNATDGEKDDDGKKKRGWVYTWNNYTDESIDICKSIKCQAHICGREVAPTTGTPHLQGSIYFTNPLSFNSVRTRLKGVSYIHQMNGTWQQCIEYCEKANDICINTGEGPIGKPGKRTDIDSFYEEIKGGAKNLELLENGYALMIAKYPRFLNFVRDATRIVPDLPDGYRKYMGLWIYGPSDIGKTRTLVKMVDSDRLYDKLSNKWWDGYTDESIVLLDDPTPNWSGHLSGYLKQWVQEKPYICEFKNGSMKIRPKKFVITANMEPAAYFGDQWPALESAFNSRFTTSFVETRDEIEDTYNSFLQSGMTE